MLTDCAGSVGWVSTAPDSEFELHGGLGVLVCFCGGGCHCPDCVPIDLPYDLIGRPVY